jgi:hypothetical protein
MEYVILWLLSGLVAMIIARSKERDGGGWFALGCLFGPFALVVAVLPSLKTDPNSPSPETPGRCPHCAEPVLKEAKVCKHCSGQIHDNT